MPMLDGHNQLAFYSSLCYINLVLFFDYHQVVTIASVIVYISATPSY